MSMYLVNYEINNAVVDYSGLEERIMKYGEYWRCLDNTWYLKINDNINIESIKDELKKFLQINDKLNVCDLLNQTVSGVGINESCPIWLRNTFTESTLASIIKEKIKNTKKTDV